MANENENANERDDVTIKNGARILTPKLHRELMRELNPTYAVIVSVLMLTGMRIEEFWEFVEHPSWYKPSKRCISLPFITKKMCRQLERDILLNDEGCAAVETLIGMKNIKRVSRHAMNEALKLAASKSIGTEGICPKMYRKSCASILMKCFPKMEMYISASMGHSRDILQKHYLGIAFSREDTEEMRILFKGWGK